MSSHRILVIADKETGIGFRLAGSEVATAETVEDAEALVSEAIDTNNYGVVLVAEGLMGQFGEKITDKIDQAGVPLVIPIPTGMLETPGEAQERYVSEMIRRTTGYTIKL